MPIIGANLIDQEAMNVMQISAKKKKKKKRVIQNAFLEQESSAKFTRPA